MISLQPPGAESQKIYRNIKICQEKWRNGILYGGQEIAYTGYEVKNMKEEEKKPVPWETVDPKPPVIRSGHLENRKQ